MARNYAVLIGDIVLSRTLDNRGAVQRKLAALCAEINKERKAFKLTSPMTITLGDEFQAVFADTTKLWECIFRTEAAMAPVEIRFAIGLGPIDTDIKRDSALGMDGPAFYAARAAMEKLKSGNTRYRVEGLSWDEYLNEVLVLISYNRTKWRKPRVVVLANLLQGKTIKEICKLVRNTEQAVYRNIRDGALDTMLTLLSGIAERMNKALR